MMYAKDRVAAVVILLVAIGVFIQTGDLNYKPAIFPRMIAAVMAIGATLMFLRTVPLRAKARPAAADDPHLDQPFFRNLPRFLIAAGGFVVYLIAIGWIGYFTSTTILVVALALALGFRDLRALAVTTVVFVALVYVVFILIFERPLPRGALF